MFEKGSRYAGLEAYQVPDAQGRTVRVVPVPDPPGESLLGYHRRKSSQRLDHLAHRYLDDPTAYWRICELADVMHPQVLLRPAGEDPDALLVPIPRNR